MNEKQIGYHILRFFQMIKTPSILTELVQGVESRYDRKLPRAQAVISRSRYV